MLRQNSSRRFRQKSNQDSQVQKHGIHRCLQLAIHHKASWWIKEMHLTSNDSLGAA
jgi:hypothetical protein